MCLSKDIISAYCDGETEGRVNDLVEKHLQECESCRKTAEAYKALSVSVKQSAFSPDQSDVTILANRIRLYQPQMAKRIRRNSYRKIPVFRLAVFLFVLLCAFTFLLFSVIIFSGGSRDGQAVMASAPAEAAVPEIPKDGPSPAPMFRPDNRNLRTVDY